MKGEGSSLDVRETVTKTDLEQKKTRTQGFSFKSPQNDIQQKANFH